jgi:hypothetical protein
MVHARVAEGLLDAVTVDVHRRVVGVLLDDREQVAEQPLFGRRQVGALDRFPSLGVLDAVDGRPRFDQGRGLARILSGALPVPGGAVLAAARLAASTRTAQTLGSGFALFRNRRPSSYLVMYAL